MCQYGLLFPTEVFRVTKQNSTLLQDLSFAHTCIERQGGIDYAQIIKIRDAANQLLYAGNWENILPKDFEYIDAAIILLQKGATLWNIDTLQYVSINQTNAGEDKRYFYIGQETITLPHVNRVFHNSDISAFEAKGCLTCGRSDHYTCDHLDYYCVNTESRFYYAKQIFEGPSHPETQSVD